MVRAVADDFRLKHYRGHWEASQMRCVIGTIWALPLISLALASVSLTGMAEAKSPPSVVNFPGDGLKEVHSRIGVTVYYDDPGPNADGIDDRPIMLRYPSGRTEQIDSFIRNADVSWSPLGDRLVVTNWIGSNVADCTAVTPSSKGARKHSLTDAINSARLAKISRDMREGDHVYVSCNRWLSPTRIEVEVNGYGCSPAPCTPRSFDHFLIYDFGTRRVVPTNGRRAIRSGPRHSPG